MVETKSSADSKTGVDAARLDTEADLLRENYTDAQLNDFKMLRELGMLLFSIPRAESQNHTVPHPNLDCSLTTAK